MEYKLTLFEDHEPYNRGDIVTYFSVVSIDSYGCKHWLLKWKGDLVVDWRFYSFEEAKQHAKKGDIIYEKSFLAEDWAYPTRMKTIKHEV